MSEDIERLKRQIDIHDLAQRLGLVRPDPRGNYRSPQHDDHSPSLQVGGRKYPDGWYDYSTDQGGDCIDLVGYTLDVDFKEAVQWLRDQYGIAEDKPVATISTQPATLVEHIAAQSLKETAPAADYLASRGLLPAVIDQAIKSKSVGFNAWVSPKKPLGSMGYGGPATAFLVRTFNPGRLVAVDLRYHDPGLNGGVKSGCQGEKVGYPWISNVRNLERAHTVVMVESPINALSAESAFVMGGLSGWAAVATRGLLVNKLELLPYRGKRMILCFDNDEPDKKGHRPGTEASWTLHALLTTQRIAAHFVDQSEWNCNDLNDFLKAHGAEKTARALEKLQPWAIPGVSGQVEPGRRRIFLPYADSVTYPHFRVREDFTSRFTEEKDDEGKSHPRWQDLAGFRIADIARIRIASYLSTLTGEVDHQAQTLFAVTTQTPYHGQELQRYVLSFDRLNNLDWWKRIGPVWEPKPFLRLINLWGRAVELNQREAVNFIGLCWKKGKLHVNEGPDAYFTDPDKQCPYHKLIFPSGSTMDAAKVIRAYSANFSHQAALLLLVWALGSHLKCLLSFWPHLTLQARKGAGKTTLTEHLSRSIACTIFSGQSLQTDFRLLTSISHTSHPVGWEELSARRQETIDKAVSMLQEAYKHSMTRRGSEMTEFVSCAPVLLVGEDVPVRSLLGKVVRVQLREKGHLLAPDLPLFPVRQWLTSLTELDQKTMLQQHQALIAFCSQRCRASGADDGARRMISNYAALLLAWRLLQDFSGVTNDEINLDSAIIQEMNEHIAETSADREPWVWIVEVVLNEITANAYPFPYRFDVINDQEVFYLRTAHMMHHIQTKPGLRAIWDSLTIKSDRVLKKQLRDAGVILSDRIDPTIDGRRVGHMVALSIAKLAEYGLHPQAPTGDMG